MDERKRSVRTFDEVGTFTAMAEAFTFALTF